MPGGRDREGRLHHRAASAQLRQSMSMKISRFRSKGGDPEPMMDINTTPLIDVMLVLLVMLIITIPIQFHAVALEMPVGTPPTSVEPDKIRIDIDQASVVYWQGLPVAQQE